MTFSRRAVLRAGSVATVALALEIGSGVQAASTPQRETVALRTAHGRAVSVTHWRASSRRGAILFSHGALSSPLFYDRVILPWVAAGYDVWAPLHVDSTDHPDRANFTGPQGWAARLEDMHLLADHVGGRGWIAAGHSYGALVALTLGGAAPVPPPGFSGPMRDSRARAVIALSPPGPMPGLVETGSYASVAVPALIQTGTMDLTGAPGSVRAPNSWRNHLLAFEEAASGGHRYALVLDGADHYFGGAICNFQKPGPTQLAQLQVVAQLSTLFADAYGMGSRRAKVRLDARRTSTGPAMLLGK